MAAIIALYPGQGSQEPKMALDLYQASSKVKELFTLASDISHVNLRKLLESGTKEELQQTKNTQLVVTLASRSAALRLSELGHTFIGHSGFSLGELSAYATSGIMSDKTLFELITIRATLMDQESEKIEKRIGKVGMAAVIGLDYERVANLLHNHKTLFAANDNSPTQVVIAGTMTAIEEIQPTLKSHGARRIIPLKVSGPFHTPFMEGASSCFKAAVEDLPFSDPTQRVISSVTGEAIINSLQAKETLITQLAKPVRWTKAVNTLAASIEPETIVGEVGYGSVLSKLAGDRLTSLPLGSEEQIQTFNKGSIQ